MNAVIKRQSKPARLADEIEALGWEVERAKTGAVRSFRAQHPDGRVVIMQFERRDTGSVARYVDTFVGGEAYDKSGRTVLDSAADGMNFVRTPPAVPFALDAPDTEVLAAVAGRTIEWRSRLTDKVQSGAVPRGGVHLRLTSGETRHGPIAPEDRVLHFSDALGFRAVRLGAIVKVN